AEARLAAEARAVVLFVLLVRPALALFRRRLALAEELDHPGGALGEADRDGARRRALDLGRAALVEATLDRGPVGEGDLVRLVGHRLLGGVEQLRPHRRPRGDRELARHLELERPRLLGGAALGARRVGVAQLELAVAPRHGADLLGAGRRPPRLSRATPAW